MKKVAILGSILALTMFLSQSIFANGTVKIYLFFSEETGGLKIEKEVIKPLFQRYPIEVQSFSVNQLRNYDLLTKFEKELKDTGNELPAIVIGDKILGGEAEIRKDLEALVKTYAEKGGTPWPSLQPIGPEEGWIPYPPTEEEKKSGKTIYAAFFYMPGCLHCEEMKTELKKWAARIPELRIRIFSLTKG